MIPVVNIVGGGKVEVKAANGHASPAAKAAEQKSPEEIAAEQQKRFQEMRAKLLNVDQAD